MNLDALMRRDHRVHLEVAGIQACPAPSDALTTTTEPLRATCAACLAGFDRLREAVASEVRFLRSAAHQDHARVAAVSVHDCSLTTDDVNRVTSPRTLGRHDRAAG